MTMTRAEHLDWAKQRALEYMDEGDSVNAIASMLSDLSKHPETVEHAGIELTGMLLLGGHLDSPDKVRAHIEGFN